MADNYIERKMEELHSRRTPLHKTTPALRPSLPRLRIVIAGEPDAKSAAIADTLAASGCRITVIHADAEAGEKQAARGLRFALANPSDPAAVADAFSATLRAWREVDAVILYGISEPSALATLSSWASHRLRLPYVASYRSRLIDITAAPSASRFALQSFPEPLKLSANRLSLRQPAAGECAASAEDIAQLCRYLCSPGAAFITATTIPVPLL